MATGTGFFPQHRSGITLDFLRDLIYTYHIRPVPHRVPEPDAAYGAKRQVLESGLGALCFSPPPGSGAATEPGAYCLPVSS